MLGVVKELGTVLRFKARKSIAQWTVFIITGTSGEAQALAEGAIIPPAVQSASGLVHIVSYPYLSGLICKHRFPQGYDCLSLFHVFYLGEKTYF